MDPLQGKDDLSQPPLNCPRCNSSNTKFCYFNNHNKAQPRHFCKSCKRHWTQGGTLRDVPVGGNRRNKRIKTNSNCNSNSNSNSNSSGSFDCVQQQQYQLGDGVNNYLESTLSLPSLPNFNFISLASFEDSISPFSFTDSIHFQSSNSDQITRLIQETPDDPINTSSITTSNTSEVMNPPWILPSTSSFVDSLSDWSWTWNDLNMLISTTDTSQPWGDFQNDEH